MTYSVAFDMDGTLVDTREATLRAYQAVGVEPPPDWWGRPWYDWMDDAELHQRKCEIYPDMLQKYGRPLAAATAIRLACAEGAQVAVLTAASLRTFRAVQRFLGLKSKQFMFRTEMTRTHKLDWLRRNGPGVYWDDDGDFLRIVRRETRWHAQIAF